MTELQWTESYTVHLGVLFYSKLSHNPDFFQIAPILLDETCMKYRSSSSSGFQCVTISNNIFQWFFIGSDGPPKPQKNEKVPLSISICVPNFFSMKLNATKCKEPQVCFVKRPSATPFTNWSTSTQNSSFAQGSRQRGRGGISQEIGAVDLWLSASLSYVPS